MYYFIVNPNSQNGKGLNVWKKTKQILERYGIEYKTFLTQKPGDATAFARELTRGIKEERKIVVVGGDGTVNEILDGLSFGGLITLGYIPAGLGNNLARSLKLPYSVTSCVKRILNPKSYRMMDYGVLSYGEQAMYSRRFMLSAGVGMDAAIYHNIIASRMNRIFHITNCERLSSLLIGMKHLIAGAPSSGYLLLDGTRRIEFKHVYFISTHIHPYEGKGFKLAPKARYDDGKLTICVMNNSNKWKFLSVVLNSWAGRIPYHRGTKFYECEEAVICTDHPMAVHVDGESCLHQKKLQIRCITKKLRMIG